jgi:hypothetical protein
MVCGGVHAGWMLVEWKDQSDVSKQIASLAEQADGDEDAAKASRKPSESNAYLDALIGTLYGLHYVLPKTSDADVFTRKLRKSIEREPPNLVDEPGELTFQRALEDLAATRRGSEEPVRWSTKLVAPPPESVKDGRITADLALANAVWTMTPQPPVSPSVRFEIMRRKRTIEPSKDAAGTAKSRPRRMSANAAADELVARLKTNAAFAVEPTTRRGEIDRATAIFVEWSEGTAEAQTVHDAALFTLGDALYEVRMSANGAWPTQGERRALFDRFLARIKLGEDEVYDFGVTRWYDQEFSLGAPWKYNILFSIGSSLAFVVLMLALSWWRIERIDF